LIKTLLSEGQAGEPENHQINKRPSEHREHWKEELFH